VFKDGGLGGGDLFGARGLGLGHTGDYR